MGWWGCDFGASVAKEKRSRTPKTERGEAGRCDGEPGGVTESLVTVRPRLLHPRSAPWPYPGLWRPQIPQDHTSPGPLPPGEAAARLNPEGNSRMTIAWAGGTCPPAPTCLCWPLAPGPANESSSLGLPWAGTGAGRGAWCPAPRGLGAELPAGSPAQHRPGLAPSLGWQGRSGSRGTPQTTRSLGVRAGFVSRGGTSGGFKAASTCSWEPAPYAGRGGPSASGSAPLCSLQHLPSSSSRAERTRTLYIYL